MPAVSQQQQKLFGLALAVKRGEVDRSEASDEVLNIVDSMTEKEIEDFASTSHSELPKKVESFLRELIRNTMREESISEAVSSKDLEAIKGAVENASSFMSVGSELKKLGMRYIFATSPMPVYIVQDKSGNRVGIVNKKYATKPDFVVGDIAVGVMENTLKEGLFQDIMRAVKKGDGPFTLVVIKNNKVIKQVEVKTPQAIPANYSSLLKDFPNTRIRIEDATGKIVMGESVNEGVINELSADTYKNTVKAALQRNDSKGNSIAVKALQSFGKAIAKELAGKSFEVKGSKDNLAKGFYRGNSQKFINQFKMTFTGEGELVNSRDVKVFGSDEVHFRMKVEFQVPDNIGGFSTDVKFRGYEKYKFPGSIQFSIKQGRVWAWFNSADTDLEFTRAGAREMAKLADIVVEAMDFPTKAKHNTIKQFDPMKVSNESVNENFAKFDTLKMAVNQHEKGAPYYDKTRLTNIFNQLSSSDQVKAKKQYSGYFGESVNEAKAGDFEIGDFIHFKSKNKTGMVKRIDGDKVTIMTMKGDFTGDIKDIKVLYQDNLNEKLDNKQLALLKYAYRDIKKINPSEPAYGRLVKHLDTLSKSELQQLADAGINFISLLAKNRLMRSESVNEGYSTEEKRIVLMAVKKIQKYMNVDLPTAMNYVLGVGKELERDIERGKIK